jgi:uncharacterized delta-60 repeat protein
MPNQAGTLDTSFGPDGSGKVTTDFNGGDDQAYSVVLTSDNQIIVGGIASTDSNSNNYDFALAKYDADGGLDTNFGPDGSGTVTTDFNGGDDRAYSVVLTSDNQIIVGGFAETNPNLNNYDFALAKYTADGTLDTNFGPDGSGKVTTDFNGGDDGAFSVVLTSDNKIIVGGSVSNLFFPNAEIALARYNADGTLDTSFGPDGSGKVTTVFNGGFTAGISVVLTSDNKIIVGGFASAALNPIISYFALAKYFNTTEPDPDQVVVLKEYVDTKLSLLMRYVLELELQIKNLSSNQ